MVLVHKFCAVMGVLALGFMNHAILPLQGSVWLEESTRMELLHSIFCSVWLQSVGMDSSPKEEYSLKLRDELVP